MDQAFTLPTSQPMHFRLAGLSTNLGWPPGALMMNADDYARAWASNAPSAYQLELIPGASLARVKKEAEATVGPESGMRVETAAQRERLHYAQASQGLSRLSQIRSLVLIAAVLAMV